MTADALSKPKSKSPARQRRCGARSPDESFLILEASGRPTNRSPGGDLYISYRGIRESRPPFVAEDLLRWLETQVSDLAERIASCSAFGEPLTKPVHGDLWLNNVLWVSRNDWHLVDWDEVRIGDPAADVAALLGASAQDPRPLKMLEHVDGLLTPTEQERLRYLGRASLLDWVIDPLSDWIDAHTAPAHADAVRTEKERIHRLALACYEGSYR